MQCLNICLLFLMPRLFFKIFNHVLVKNCQSCFSKLNSMRPPFSSIRLNFFLFFRIPDNFSSVFIVVSTFIGTCVMCILLLILVGIVIACIGIQHHIDTSFSFLRIQDNFSSVCTFSLCIFACSLCSTCIRTCDWFLFVH